MQYLHYQIHFYFATNYLQRLQPKVAETKLAVITTVNRTTVALWLQRFAVQVGRAESAHQSAECLPFPYNEFSFGEILTHKKLGGGRSQHNAHSMVCRSDCDKVISNCIFCCLLDDINYEFQRRNFIQTGLKSWKIDFTQSLLYSLGPTLRSITYF